MNDAFLRACRRLPADHTPVWFMRQAGRYMAEYRTIRARHTLLEICRQPELAAEVTLQPVNRIEVDAAILFSDLLLPLEPLGIPFDFVKGEGPAIERPVRSAEDVGRLRRFEPREALAHVLADHPHPAPRTRWPRAAGRLRRAPFTLASYAVEGGASRTYALTKGLMYSQPEVWHELCDTFAAVIGDYLLAQVEAGAQALQLFDSWAGALSVDDYREFALPHTRRILDTAAAGGVPIIHFGTGTATLLEAMTEAGGDVVGVDWRVALDEAWERIGDGQRRCREISIPTLLLGPVHRMLDGAEAMSPDRRAGAPGTSSISGTASCRRRRWKTCRRWPTSSVRPRCLTPTSAWPSWAAASAGLPRRTKLHLRGRRSRGAGSAVRASGGVIRTDRDGRIRPSTAVPTALLAQTKPAALDLCRELGLGDAAGADPAAAHRLRAARRAGSTRCRQAFGVGHSDNRLRRSRK